MAWGVFEYHDSVHVICIDEADEHKFMDCDCGVRYENGVYIHNAIYIDVSEVEDGLEKPTKKLYS